MTAATLFFDEDCGFCRWAVDVVLRRAPEGSIRAVPIGSAEGDRLLRDLDHDARYGSWHFFDEDGTRTSAGAAVVPLATRVRGGRPIAGLARTFPALMERLYRAVARRRHSLGRFVGADRCEIREP